MQPAARLLLLGVESVGRRCCLDLEYVHGDPAVHCRDPNTVRITTLGALGMSGGCAAVVTAVWMTPAVTPRCYRSPL